MTTAHRPTFDPARGREPFRGPTYHQTTLPAHKQLKYRKPGQGGSASTSAPRDLAAELLAAEAEHLAKKSGGRHHERSPSPVAHGTKRVLASSRDDKDQEEDEEELEAKRRRILLESRDIDADETSEDSDSEEDDDDDDDDDSDAELQRELDRVRREKEAGRRRAEEERVKREEEERERDIALGNPLLNKQDFTIKRRWDDDVVFKNQARGTGDKKKEFINDTLRSDFHRRFMDKYVR